MKPSIGRIVHYVLSQQDVDSIQSIRQRMAELLQISAGQIGNSVRVGEVVPAQIGRVWDASTGLINGQATLDGFDNYWLRSCHMDECKAPGTWHWPERELPLAAKLEPMTTAQEIWPGAKRVSITPGSVVIECGDLAPPELADLAGATLVGDSISRMDEELSLDQQVMLTQLELRIRQLCGLIETCGASAELTKASVEASNARQVLAAMVEKTPLPPYIKKWLGGAV